MKPDTSAPTHTGTTITLIRLPEVVKRTGLSRSSVYQLGAAGAFPLPRRLASQTVAWRSDEIDNWIAARPAVTR